MPENQIIMVSPVPREIEDDDDPVKASNHAITLGLYADALRRTAHEHELLFIDLHGPLRNAHSPGGIARDGLHLDAHGWFLAEQEILWNLGMRDDPPDLFLPSTTTGMDEEEEQGTLELDLLKGRTELPTLPGTMKLDEPSEPSLGITWGAALEHVEHAAGGEDSFKPDSYIAQILKNTLS